VSRLLKIESIFPLEFKALYVITKKTLEKIPYVEEEQTFALLPDLMDSYI